MDFWERKEETDGREHIESIKSRTIKYILVLLGIFTGVAAGISVKAKADSYYHYMYDIRMRYTKEKVTLKFTLEDIGNTCIGHDYAGAGVYAFDTYLKDESLPDGQWQLAMDVRKSGIVKLTETDFGISDMPVSEVDITNLYNNTKAFKKTDSDTVECSKFTDNKSVTFKGNGYYNYVILAVVSKYYPTDRESLYQYLEQTTYDKSGKKVRDTFFEYNIVMKCVSSQYKVNDGEWQNYQDVTKKFEYKDYRDGDVIWFRGVYEDGSYSAPINHVVSKLNVHVDPAGGIINGHDSLYTCVSDGTYGDNVYIASDNEQLEGVGKVACEREGHTFNGFEFVDGYGDIIEKRNLGYVMYADLTNTITGEKATITEQVNQDIIDQYQDKEMIRQYYIDYLYSIFGSYVIFSFTDDDVKIVTQNQIMYYVNSSLADVTVRAIWRTGDEYDEKENYRYTLIKAASTRYKDSMIKRTAGDDGWYDISNSISLSGNMTEYRGNVAAHIRILPSGYVSSQ